MARGKSKVKFDIPLAQKVAMDRAMKGVRGATLEAQRITQVDILSSNPPRTGRKYKRGKKLYHTASAPGEAPAPDRGILRASINVQFERDNLQARGVVYSNLAYGADLELGSKLPPRPWISRLLGGEYVDRIRRAFYRFAGL